MMDRTTKEYAWLVVAILWFVSLLNYLDRLLIASMRTPIKADIPMTDAEFGLLTSAFLVIYAILSPLGGYLADRFSRKWVIFTSLLLWSVVTLITGFVENYTQLIVTRAIMGVSEAFYMPAAVALVMDYHKGPTRSKASGILMTGLYAGMALGGLGGYIATIWSWQIGYHLFGGLGILYAVVVYFTLDDAPGKEPEPGEQQNDFNFIEMLKSLFSSRGYLIILLYGLLGGICVWLIYAWLPTFFQEGFNLSVGKAGVSGTFYVQVASFAGVLLGGFFADKWAVRNNKGRIYITAIAFMVGGPFLYLMAAADLYWIAVLGIVIFGLTKGNHDANFMPIITQVVNKKYQATGYGIMSFFSVLSGAAMIYVGGYLKDIGISLDLVFKIAGIGILISGVVLLAVRPNKEN
ncbi:MFS transporter [Mariniphaga sediminis]|uniref:MFS transporter n=1 Tax=Mariniphaga sediminis TaxID=1628158 RepID=A0A399D160_9BACT|nr:MFS transporter [Mariniphaga sediminis]RIH64472.1 MFS transporter [Mariniphaga sediminis]